MRSCDPQGQIQGHRKGLKVNDSKHAPILKLLKYLESLSNYLSSNI